MKDIKMNLVIDANILMSALISTNGFTFNLILNEKIELIAPEFLFEEIEKYREEIYKKSGLSYEEFNLFLSLLYSEINFIPKEDFNQNINLAKQICPDENDTEYFALALAFNCSLWSNDKKLKEQDKIKVYSTEELTKLFN
jgi:predicted nucleic acid-binding protein